MTPETVHQYQVEERTLMAKRIGAARHMIKDLLDVMKHDTISTEEKITRLKNELTDFYKNESFRKARSMGELVKMSLKEMIRKNKFHVKQVL